MTNIEPRDIVNYPGRARQLAFRGTLVPGAAGDGLFCGVEDSTLSDGVSLAASDGASLLSSITHANGHGNGIERGAVEAAVVRQCEPAPPASDTGVQTPQATIDYLRFVLPYSQESFDLVAEFFGAGTPLGVGMYGYANSLLLPCGGRVAWHPERADMGILLELGSAALGRWCAMGGHTDLLGFIRFMLDFGAKVRRLDVAWDDRTGLLDMSVISEAVQSRTYTSRWRRTGGFWERRGDVQSRTFTWGSRESEAYLRIYDKEKEQLLNQGIHTGHWIRVEVEFKGEKAHQVAGQVADRGAAYAAGVLSGLIEFKVPTAADSSHRYRAAVASWWAAFLGAVAKVRLGGPRVFRPIDAIKRWITRQVAPALSLISVVDGDLRFLHSAVVEGRGRWSAWYRFVAEQQLASRAYVGAGV